MILKYLTQSFSLFPWSIHKSIISSELTLKEEAFVISPSSHKYGHSGKNIYEFAKINSHHNISVTVRNLYDSIQSEATSVNKVTRT